jgi:hypothetical protein
VVGALAEQLAAAGTAFELVVIGGAAPVSVGLAERATRDVDVDALAAAGVATQRARGKERVYALDRTRWLSLLDLESPPEFIDWPRLLRLLLELQHWLESDARQERSNYMRASAARDFVERVGPLLGSFNVQPSAAQFAAGPSYWPVFVQTIDNVLARLAPTSAPS